MPQQNLIFAWPLCPSPILFSSHSQRRFSRENPLENHPRKNPLVGLCSQKASRELPCHLGGYLEARGATGFTSRQATPEVTEQEGLQTKLRRLNHIIYLINLKHSKRTSLVV